MQITSYSVKDPNELDIIDAAGPADNADFAAADFAGECIAVGLDIGLEHGGRTVSHGGGYEFI